MQSLLSILNSGVQAGGIFVNKEAEKRLCELFTGHSIPESQQVGWVRTAMHDFERVLKPSYSGSATAPHFLQITSDEYVENEALGIVLGRLPLMPYVHTVRLPRSS